MLFWYVCICIHVFICSRLCMCFFMQLSIFKGKVPSPAWHPETKSDILPFSVSSVCFQFRFVCLEFHLLIHSFPSSNFTELPMARELLSLASSLKSRKYWAYASTGGSGESENGGAVMMLVSWWWWCWGRCVWRGWDNANEKKVIQEQCGCIRKILKNIGWVSRWLNMNDTSCADIVLNL